MVFMPPRHGKSELVTVRYTAWRFNQDPTLNVIVGSYNQKLANRFSRKIKNSLHDSRQSVPIAVAGAVHGCGWFNSNRCYRNRSVPGAVATGAVSYSRRVISSDQAVLTRSTLLCLVVSTHQKSGRLDKVELFVRSESVEG